MDKSSHLKYFPTPQGPVAGASNAALANCSFQTGHTWEAPRIGLAIKFHLSMWFGLDRLHRRPIGPSIDRHTFPVTLPTGSTSGALASVRNC